MKYFVILILSFIAMASGEMRNGMGFFVNSEYIVTAYHVIENFENTCYYDIENDTCYQVYVRP
jgi:hypothetical protein